MSDKYLVIIDAKGIKKKIKYFLINKANHKLLDIIDFGINQTFPF